MKALQYFMTLYQSILILFCWKEPENSFDMQMKNFRGFLL